MSDYRNEAREVMNEVPWTIGKAFTHMILPLMALSVIVGIIGYGLGWFGEAAQVAQQEFGPKAALTKYQWFIDQQNAIQKMDQDVRMYEARVKKVDDQYATYGTDRSKWPPDVRVQYNHENQQAREDLLAIASQRNNLVKEYNADSEKFNWSPFQTRPDKPRQNIDEYVIK
jgi:hypothetical protein